MPGKKKNSKKAKPEDSCPKTPIKSKVHEVEGKDVQGHHLVSPSPNKVQEPSTNETERSPVRRLAFGKATEAKRIVVPESAKAVYKILNKATGSLGGNGYNGAIYGELTIGSMQKVINILKDFCNMDHTSRFIDVGAGLGKPNFHAAQDPQVRLSIGIELEDIRWQLSMQNLNFLMKYVKKNMVTESAAPPDTKGDDLVTPVPSRSSKRSASSKPEVIAKASSDKKKIVEVSPDVRTDSNKVHAAVNFIVSDIDVATTMDPFTHIYMYDLGFPPELQSNIAKKFNSSVHARYLVSYRAPRLVIDSYDYNVRFICSLNTSMFGSGENHTAYFYERIIDDEHLMALTNQSKKSSASQDGKANTLVLPGRRELLEEDEEVFCDPLFYEASKLAVGPVEDLASHAEEISLKFISRGREKRERKPRQIE